MNQPAVERPRFPLTRVVLITLILLAPTLAMGFLADDAVHQLMLAGSDSLRPTKPWALFDFGTRADWTGVEGEIGSFPFWTDDAWRVRFLRPVSSLALAFQHRVFASQAVYYHVVGLLGFTCLIRLVFRLFLDLGLGPRTASTGALLFALCDSVILPVGWLANANSLLVALFSVGALRAALPGTSGRVHPLLAVGLAVLAALSKEEGAVTLLLIGGALARAARRAPGPAERAPAIGAVLSFTLLLAYAALLIGADYGTNSLFYATPWVEPAAFAANLVVLFGAGFVSLSGPFPLDVLTPFPELRLPLALAGLVLGPLLVLWVGRRARGLPGMGWLTLWTLAFLVVQAGAPPADRLLFVPAIGAAGLLAAFFEQSRSQPSPSRAVRTATRVLWYSVTIGSGLFLCAQGIGLTLTARHFRATTPRTEVGPRELGPRDLFVLQTESQMQAFTLPSTWALESPDHDLVFWACQFGNRAVRWTRIDDTTFELESLDAPFLANTFERLFLTEEPRCEVGRRWSTPAFEVEARAVTDGLPTHLRFTLKRSLDDPAVRFLAPARGVLASLPIPAIGEPMVLAKPERFGPYVP